MERIGWLLCSGMGGYFGADWVATLLRSMQFDPFTTFTTFTTPSPPLHHPEIVIKMAGVICMNVMLGVIYVILKVYHLVNIFVQMTRTELLICQRMKIVMTIILAIR